MGRERKRTNTDLAGRSDSSQRGQPPVPHTQIERIELKDYNAAQFSHWLEHWKQLKNEGWDVTILVVATKGDNHAIALACKDA